MIGRRSDKVGEAARAWVLRLEDGHSAADRARFERWLAEDSSHQLAYDRSLASFRAAGVLRTSAIGRGRNLEAAFAPRRSIVRRAALAAMALLLIIGGLHFGRSPGLLGPAPAEAFVLTSGISARHFTLHDGTRLILEPHSQVEIRLGAEVRRADLRKGRMRMVVADDRRPFQVVADGVSKSFRTGAIDATLDGGRGQVSASASGERTSEPASGVEFDAEPLGQAVARINALGSGPRIRVAPGISTLPVTGVYRPDDHAAFAKSLAIAFHLHLTTASDGSLILSQ